VTRGAANYEKMRSALNLLVERTGEVSHAELAPPERELMRAF
jgi:hypothetical protein